jgi:hypothetical protein
MYFHDTDDPREVYPRSVCRPCADHITYARSRGGERLTAVPAVATAEEAPEGLESINMRS